MSATQLEPAQPPGRPPESAAEQLAERTPPWRPWTAPAALVLALVVANVLGTVVYVISIAGRNDGGHSNVADLIATLIQDVCFVGSALFFAQLAARPRAVNFGLRPTRLWPAVGLVVGGYAAFFALTAAWLGALGLHEHQDLPRQLGADDGPVALAAVILLITVVAPICEEFLFRGYMFGALRRRAGVWGAAAIVGLLFGGVHAISSPVGFLAPLALFGFGLCLIYAWSGSLYPCIVLHALNNSLALGTSEHWTWQIPLLVVGALAAIGTVLGLLSRRAPALAPRG